MCVANLNFYWTIVHAYNLLLWHYYVTSFVSVLYDAWYILPVVIIVWSKVYSTNFVHFTVDYSGSLDEVIYWLVVFKDSKTSGYAYSYIGYVWNYTGKSPYSGQLYQPVQKDQGWLSCSWVASLGLWPTSTFFVTQSCINIWIRVAFVHCSVLMKTKVSARETYPRIHSPTPSFPIRVQQLGMRLAMLLTTAASRRWRKQEALISVEVVSSTPQTAATVLTWLLK